MDERVQRALAEVARSGLTEELLMGMVEDYTPRSHNEWQAWLRKHDAVTRRYMLAKNSISLGELQLAVREKTLWVRRVNVEHIVKDVLPETVINSDQKGGTVFVKFYCDEGPYRVALDRWDDTLRTSRGVTGAQCERCCVLSSTVPDPSKAVATRSVTGYDTKIVEIKLPGEL